MLNAAPVAVADAYSMHAGGYLHLAAANGVLNNDTDADNDALTAVNFSNPSHGWLMPYSSGEFYYGPSSTFVGADTFQYKAFDGTDYSDWTTVTINVANSAPTVIDHGPYQLRAGSYLNVSAANGLLAGSADADGDTLHASIVTNASHGYVMPYNDGGFYYYAYSGYTGADSFTFKANDGLADSNIGTVTIDVTGVNNTAPTVIDHGPFNVHPGSNLNVSAANGLLAGSADADGDTLHASIVTNASHGYVMPYNDGSFYYYAYSGYTGADSFTFKANDGLAEQ